MSRNVAHPYDATPRGPGVASAPDRARGPAPSRAALAAAFALALALSLAPRSADALEGFRCQHTPQCSHDEVCVADSLASTWGTCRKMRVLP